MNPPFHGAWRDNLYLGEGKVPKIRFSRRTGSSQTSGYGVSDAVSLLRDGEEVFGDHFACLAPALRALAGVDTGRRVDADLCMDGHSYYRVSPEVVIDVDYSERMARRISLEAYGVLCSAQLLEFEKDMQRLREEGYIELTFHEEKDVAAAFGLGCDAVPVLVEEFPGSDSHCASRRTHYALKDGRFLVIGNGCDEGWRTAYLSKG